jgi:MFS family permease
VILGSALSLIGNVYVILVGRFIWGIGAGSFTVLTPKFINETSPLEKKGFYGTFN